MRFVLILLIFAWLGSVAQPRVRISKEIKIDTLGLWINYPPAFDNEKLSKYGGLLHETIKKGNAKFSFFTRIESANSNFHILINLDSIKYVNKKDNLSSSAGNLLSVAVHVAMASTLGWTIPILVYFDPETTSEVEIVSSEKLTNSIETIDSKIASSGYFRSKNKQDGKFERTFQKTIYKLLKNVNKQNLRNTRRQGA